LGARHIDGLHDQNKSGFFGGPTFIQPIRATRKGFKSPDWLEKSRPSKKPLLFWSCKQANSVRYEVEDSKSLVWV